MVGIVAKMDTKEEKKLERCREVSKGMDFILDVLTLGNLENKWMDQFSK